MKQRLYVLRKMNVHLQKLMKYHKRKGEQADALVKRCVDTERINEKLVSIAFNGGNEGMVTKYIQEFGGEEENK